jgi:preprotein translocase subunit SecB
MAKIRLKDIMLQLVEFSANPKFNKEKPFEKGLTLNLSVESSLDETAKSIAVTLKVNSPSPAEEPDYPFFYTIVMKGAFQFDPDTNDKNLEMFAKINCPAILFPYVRETLADLTRRAGFAPLHLPVMNFAKLSKKDSTSKD